MRKKLALPEVFAGLKFLVKIKLWITTIPFHVAGLYPDGEGRGGAYVTLLHDWNDATVVQGKADRNGEFNARIKRGYAGSELRLVVRRRGFVYDFSPKLKVFRWGLHVPVKQNLDAAYESPELPDQSWNSNAEFAKAHAIIQRSTRNAKWWWWLQPLDLILTMGAVVLTWCADPVISAAAGAITYLTMKFIIPRMLREPETTDLTGSPEK
jgi:hypothetical protein